MGNRTAKNIAEQLEGQAPIAAEAAVADAVIDTTGATSEAGGTRRMNGDLSSPGQAPDITKLLYNDHAVLTADLIVARIKGAMELLDLAFTDLEVRVQGSNGRLYRPGRPMPDGVHVEQSESGEDVEVRVNRLDFKRKDMLSALVNKCERALDNETQRIEDQQKQLAKVIRLESVGRATQSNIDFETNKLESMIEQSAVTLTAFRAAYAAYGELTGEEYETKAMRQERERLMARTPAAVHGDDRVAKLLAYKPAA